MTGLTALGGTIKITFIGGAGLTYRIERALTLQNGATVWTNIGSATTDAAGQGEFTDDNSPVAPAQAFYRTVSP